MTEPERRILTRAMPNPYPWPTDLPPERAILTDLIAELRCEWETFTAGDGNPSIRMKDDGWVKAAADRAEARLRELNKE